MNLYTQTWNPYQNLGHVNGFGASMASEYAPPATWAGPGFGQASPSRIEVNPVLLLAGVGILVWVSTRLARGERKHKRRYAEIQRARKRNIEFARIFGR